LKIGRIAELPQDAPDCHSDLGPPLLELPPFNRCLGLDLLHELSDDFSDLLIAHQIPSAPTLDQGVIGHALLVALNVPGINLRIFESSEDSRSLSGQDLPPFRLDRQTARHQPRLTFDLDGNAQQEKIHLPHLKSRGSQQLRWVNLKGFGKEDQLSVGYAPHL
jgi:hypothetical protein